MVYPEQVEQKIGFDQIRILLKEKCQSSLGAAWADKIKFTTDFKLLEKLLGQTREFIQIQSSGEGFPGGSFQAIGPYLNKAKIEGSYLQEDELHQIKLSLQTLTNCLKFFNTTSSWWVPSKTIKHA